MNSNSTSEYAVEVRGLTKTFRRCRALDDVSLQIPKGAVYGLIGPNGAGKSTLIRVLMGLITKDAGDVYVLNDEVFRHPQKFRDRVGYVPDSPRIYGWMTVDQAIDFVRRAFSRWDDKLIKELLDRLELPGGTRVKHLSKGMRTRLSLLLAVAHRPELLVLDEPLSGLDPLAKEKVLEGVLATVCDGSCTVLISSHSLEDLQKLTDRVGFLYEGKMILDERTELLVQSTKRIRAVLSDGCTPRVAGEQVVYQRLNQREWLLTVQDFEPGFVEQLRGENQLEQVDVIDISLEDLFKDVVSGRRQK